MHKKVPVKVSVNKVQLKVLLVLFFLSGVAGLMLQIVWMYRLGLVFGNSAYAIAATLSSFFLGLAIGGWFWGNTATHLRRPLRVYGLMEVGIALSALLLIPGIYFYEQHYSTVVNLLSANSAAITVAKFIFSTILLLLPTVLMGGTFPVLIQYIGQAKEKLASRGTILYSLNTLGAAIGALLAGFFFFKVFGVSSTYFIAVALAGAVGVIAIVSDRLVSKNKIEPVSSAKIETRSVNQTSSKRNPIFELSYTHFILIAFISGLLALSAETLWTRMFAQILQNSVYSFSAVLVVFLVALGLGGLLSHFLVRSSYSPIKVLFTLLTLSAFAIGVSPFVFNLATNGLDYLVAGSSWLDYLLSVFGLAFIVVLPPTVILGAIFPFLLKTTSLIERSPGRFAGKLVLFNSIGGTIGPIIAGFILLDTVGLWNSIKIVGVIYAGTALFISSRYFDQKRLRMMTLPIVSILVMITIVNPPLVRLNSNERILDSWQSSDGVVSVVRSGDNIKMRLDNFYVLGDSRSTLVEQMQAHVPLLIHPSPKKVLFLGMGTGITAGAALNHGVEQAIVVELVGNVVPAAKKYFSPWVNGLFEDRRVEIIADDARNFLLGTEAYFDVIVGDLFTPWHAGTGSLYTIEHFRRGKERLAKGGFFAQWLPLYQLTPESFNVIAATFAQVFPQVTLWRADFSAYGTSIVLIGQEADAKLSQDVLQRNIINVVGNLTEESDHMATLFYLGNLAAIQNRLEGAVLNTDDKRSIEFNAPILSLQATAGQENFMVGDELEKLLNELALALPPDQDPYLSQLPAHEIRYVNVGLKYFEYQRLLEAGKKSEASSVLDQINTLAPEFLNSSKD